MTFDEAVATYKEFIKQPELVYEPVEANSTRTPNYWFLADEQGHYIAKVSLRTKVVISLNLK